MHIILLVLGSMSALSVMVCAFLAIKLHRKHVQPLEEKKQALAEIVRKFVAASAAERALIQRMKVLTANERDTECSFFASEEHTLEVKRKYSDQLAEHNADLRILLGVPSECLGMLLRARSERLHVEPEKDVIRTLEREGVFPPLHKSNTNAAKVL